MRIFITGATGFIGSHITRILCRKHEVSVLVRPDARLDFIQTYPVKIIKGDLSAKETLKEALQGIDLVIHTAAKASDWGRYQDFFEANVTGTLNIIDALPSGTRMIHISTNAVLGEEDGPTPKPETAPYAPILPYVFESLLPSGMNHYRLTKTIAEQMLIKRAEARGIDLTVVRPVWVYGPREFHAGPYEYCQTVKSGVPMIPGSKSNRFHVIYVEDLARIVAAIAARPFHGITVYHAGNPDVPLMETYWKTFCKELGLPKPANIPKFLLYPLGILLELLWQLAGATTPPLFTRARVTLFYVNNVYGIDHLRRDFPEFAFTPLEKGIQKTVRWWKRHGFLEGQ